MQRLFDVCLSFIALIILSPLLVPIVILLKFSGEGEVFYLQERIGKDMKIFRLFKFTTMLKNSPNIGTKTLTVKGDPRILPAGKFLRKTKINELPQLLNVFLGDMSLVGPRPLTKQAFMAYSSETRFIIKRVKPGLSGIGSIIFRREEEILDISTGQLEFYAEVIAPYKGILEEWFVQNQSIYVYFITIFLTIWVILFPSSKLVWKIFSDLPAPPLKLKRHLNDVR